MVYFMTKNCISIQDNPQWDLIRSETLKRCYDLPGYKELPLEYKNLIYDKIKLEVEKEYTT